MKPYASVFIDHQLENRCYVKVFISFQHPSPSQGVREFQSTPTENWITEKKEQRKLEEGKDQSQECCI